VQQDHSPYRDGAHIEQGVLITEASAAAIEPVHTGGTHRRCDGDTGQKAPKKEEQREYYSGKKKRHTLKAQAIIDLKSERILAVSTGKGRDHDLTLFRSSGVKLLKRTCLLCDRGYNGIRKDHANVMLPYKRTKLKDLTKAQQAYNRRLARKRVRIEHVFARMKVFKILAEKYRNRRERYALHVMLIAAILNFQLVR
jgi:hypothetical protein